MQDLARCAMAVLCRKWTLSTQLILDSPAVAAALVQSVEAAFAVMYLVGHTEFPFVLLPVNVARLVPILCSLLLFFLFRGHSAKGYGLEAVGNC